MFEITCPHCHRRSLAFTRDLLTFDNTAAGPVATVRCPRGHAVRHHFRSGRTDAVAAAHAHAA